MCRSCTVTVYQNSLQPHPFSRPVQASYQLRHINLAMAPATMLHPTNKSAPWITTSCESMMGYTVHHYRDITKPYCRGVNGCNNTARAEELVCLVILPHLAVMCVDHSVPYATLLRVQRGASTRVLMAWMPYVWHVIWHRKIVRRGCCVICVLRA